MFTAKIMYCLWVTLAQDDDTFVLETTKSLPKKYKKMSEKQQKEFIRERILGKSNEELVKVFFFQWSTYRVTYFSDEEFTESGRKNEFTWHYLCHVGREYQSSEGFNYFWMKIISGGVEYFVKFN